MRDADQERLLELVTRHMFEDYRETLTDPAALPSLDAPTIDQQ